jgi:hypothetical protein
MTGINDTGCLVGEASDSGGNLHGVLLLPVTINVISYLNPAPAGQPITSASATCVGEPVTLSITGTNDIPGYNFVAGYNWHVPGAIKNYLVNSGSNPVIQLSSTDTTATSPTLYYPVVQQNGAPGTVSTSGTEMISCDLSLVTGETCTVSGTLHLEAPTGNVSATTLNPVQDQAGQAGDRYITNDSVIYGSLNAIGDELEIHAGIDMSYAVQNPPDFTGSSAAVQIANNLAIRDNTGNPPSSRPDVHGELDTSFPYPAPLQIFGSKVWDGPAYENLPEGLAPWSVAGDQYTMYIMYKPTISNSIWVPVASLTWKWFFIDADTQDSNLMWSGWSLIKSGETLGNGSNCYTEPTWSGILNAP